jgi:hypothetical protein
MMLQYRTYIKLNFYLLPTLMTKLLSEIRICVRLIVFVIKVIKIE